MLWIMVSKESPRSNLNNIFHVMQLYMVCSAIWSILREVASRGPSALADILVYTATVISHDTVLEMW